MKVVAHCLVKNEERFIWYALMSALPFVDKIMVWDTGSTDKTLSIIAKIKDPKIELRRLSDVDAESHTAMRDQMIKATSKDFDWIMVLDGDEVWPETSLKKALDQLSSRRLVALGVKTINFLGDIYHRSPDSAGRYNLGGKTGHYNLRFVKHDHEKLCVRGPHGQQGYYLGKTLLQDLLPPQLIVRDDIYYFHASHLARSLADKGTLKRAFKFKYEIGDKLPVQILPEILLNPPLHIPRVNQKAGIFYWLLALVYTLPKRLRRRFLSIEHGY